MVSGTKQKPKFSGLSLFSGCGGSDLGMLAAGIDVVKAVEINNHACTLYKRVTGLESIEQADIRTIDMFPKVDILSGCYPCQGYSQGGRRENTDAINFLYREFDRVLRQTKPLAFIVENVNGMRFAQNSVLLRSQLTRFRLAGYRVSWKELNAMDYGVPQERRRLFLVGIRTTEHKLFRFPLPTHGVDGLPHSTQKDAIWNLRNAPAGSYNEEPFHWYYLSRNRRREWNEPAKCVVAHWRHTCLHPDSPALRRIHTDKWVFARSGIARRLSFLECAALQGFPNPFVFDGVPVRERFKAIGNAVPPPLFRSVAIALLKQLEAKA
jgi:DNA (cytosine-5)-methyltransferase 1